MSDEKTKKEPENPEPEEEVVEFEFNEDPEGKSTSYGAGGEEELVRKLQKLKLELKACRKEKEEYLTGWQKERADFANYKKEDGNRRAMFIEVAKEDILSRFLTIIDSFNMAFANKEAWEKVDKNWRSGVEYIYSQMNSVFEEYGVKEIGKEGEVFNPNLHHSMELISTDKKELDHTISQVIQKGYRLGDRVLRAARVNVYDYKVGE